MAGSVELRLTGGATNNGPSLSLGGIMSSVVVAATSINNLFDNTNQDEAQIGSTDYRAIDITNTSTDMEILTPTVYLNPLVNSSSVTISLGLETTGNPHVSTWSGVITTAENIDPTGISFAQYPSSAPLSLSDIAVGQVQRLWIKRSVAANAIKKCPTAFTLNLDGEYGLSFMSVLSVDPTDNEVDVALDKVIKVVFDSVINSSLLTTADITLTADSSARGFSVSLSGSTLSITPSTNLPSDADVVCTLSTNIQSTAGKKLVSAYQWNFQTLSQFYLFFTCDALQPSTNDYAPGITISYASSSTDTLNSTYRLYGTGCLKLANGQYMDIVSTNLDTMIKNFALNFYTDSSSTAIYKIISMLDSTGGSLLDITYNGNSQIVSIGGIDLTATFNRSQYHFINIVETTANVYELKINNSNITLSSSVSVPSNVATIRIADSATGQSNMYVDNIISSK
jgi:hypothetical protein